MRRGYRRPRCRNDEPSSRPTCARWGPEISSGDLLMIEAHVLVILGRMMQRVRAELQQVPDAVAGQRGNPHVRATRRVTMDRTARSTLTGALHRCPW